MRVVFILLLFFSTKTCVPQKEKNLPEIFTKEIINNSKMRNFLHVELDSRRDLAVLKNDLVKNYFSFESDGLVLKVKEKNDIDNLNYIEFIKIEVNNIEANVVFFMRLRILKFKLPL